jgi:hypothetical protein
MQLGHWHSKITITPDDVENNTGFVYIITNKLNCKQYIGQKQFWSKVSRPPLKGRVNRRISRKASDWRSYTGSSRQLNEDIAAHGKHNFDFEIICLADCKWLLTYTEYELIIKCDAIRKSSYYNEFLGRVGKVPTRLKR